MKGIRILHTKKGKAKSGMKVFNYKLFIQRGGEGASGTRWGKSIQMGQPREKGLKGDSAVTRERWVIRTSLMCGVGWDHLMGYAQ